MLGQSFGFGVPLAPTEPRLGFTDNVFPWRHPRYAAYDSVTFYRVPGAVGRPNPRDTIPVVDPYVPDTGTPAGIAEWKDGLALYYGPTYAGLFAWQLPAVWGLCGPAFAVLTPDRF